MYPHHLLLPLFPLLLPLTLAVPAPAPTTTSASFPCASVAGDWQIFDLESFTAARGTNGVSNIDFNVIDGSTFLSPVIANCNRTLPAGQTVFDPYHFYPCEERNPEGVGLQFKYTNTSLSFRQRCTANDGAKQTASGNRTITNICRTDSAGTTCTSDNLMFDIFPRVS